MRALGFIILVSLFIERRFMVSLSINRVINYNGIQSINCIEFTGYSSLAAGTFMSNIDDVTSGQIGNITIGTEDIWHNLLDQTIKVPRLHYVDNIFANLSCDSS